jgi:hypothetical protein
VLTLYSCHESGLIEDGDPNGVMVDFANKYVGGGVLGHGAVQEEILMSIFPGLNLISCVGISNTMFLCFFCKSCI